jgi:hypothetical protein
VIAGCPLSLDAPGEGCQTDIAALALPRRLRASQRLLAGSLNGTSSGRADRDCCFLDATGTLLAGARDIQLPARYRATERLAGGRCPIEAGLICRLADHECRHGRLAFDRTAHCGCWPEEGAVVRALPEAASRTTRPESRRTAA